MGRAPDLNSNARSVASWNEKFPEITPLPVVIGSLIEGALTIFPSNIIANLLPTLSVVVLPNFWAPSLSRLKETVGSFVWLLKTGWASIKFSPLITTLLLTFKFSPVSDTNFSDPNSSFVVTSLKLSCAVFPRRLLILSGSFNPGNSTKILFSPLCKIVGSFVPTSSILRLTISIDCFNAELFKVNNPYFENKISTLLSAIGSKLSSKELYLSIYGLKESSFFENNNNSSFSISSIEKDNFFSLILKFE